jgi:hypothetical protein
MSAMTGREFSFVAFCLHGRDCSECSPSTATHMVYIKFDSRCLGSWLWLKFPITCVILLHKEYLEICTKAVIAWPKKRRFDSSIGSCFSFFTY